MDITENILCQIMEHLRDAPNLLHYTVTSPTATALRDGTEVEDQWVFTAVFANERKDDFIYVEATDPTFGRGLGRFMDAIMEHTRG